MLAGPARSREPPRRGERGPHGPDESIDPECHASHRAARHGLLKCAANAGLLEVDEKSREDDRGNAAEKAEAVVVSKVSEVLADRGFQHSRT